MLGIVIPLRSRVTTHDWENTSRLLARTLQSIENQTHDGYRVAVVGHEPPLVTKTDFPFYSIDAPLPALAQGGSYHRRNDFDRIADKNRKILRGLQILRDEEIDHWFYMDADDLVSNRLVEVVTALDENAGAILDGGYQIHEQIGRAVPTRELSQICGSTCVLPASCFEIPNGISDEEVTQIPWCRFPHSRMRQFFESQADLELQVIAEPLVGYVLGHGENCSDEFRLSPVKRLKSWLKPRLIGKQIDVSFRNEFGIA